MSCRVCLRVCMFVGLGVSCQVCLRIRVFVGLGASYRVCLSVRYRFFVCSSLLQSLRICVSFFTVQFPYQICIGFCACGRLFTWVVYFHIYLAVCSMLLLHMCRILFINLYESLCIYMGLFINLQRSLYQSIWFSLSIYMGLFAFPLYVGDHTACAQVCWQVRVYVSYRVRGSM